MLIFYTFNRSLFPIVVIDAMSSDDRFSTKEIQKEVMKNVPTIKGNPSVSISSLKVFSCEYSAQFEHIGIPLGSALKSKFSASIKSPSAELILFFAPTFNNSANSISQMSDPNFKIPNIKTNITYAAMVVKGADENTISRKFIVYAAPLYPDTYGTLITMVLHGAMVDDILIKGAVAVQIDKKSSFKSQMDKFLNKLNPSMTADYSFMSHPTMIPATEKIFPPMKLNNLLSELCLQNRLVYTIDYSKNIVKFYNEGQSSAPKQLDYKPAKFSFLGSVGYMAWGLGVENYANIKFKSAIFDCKLFNKVIIYNDIQSKFFGGLVKNPAPPSTVLKKVYDSYDAWIIRYLIKWSRQESICEVTSSNNWVMSQFRVDGLMETAIYEASGLL